MSQSVVQAIRDLIKNGSIDKEPSYSMPSFAIENIYPIVKHLFNTNAIKALENKTYDELYQYNEYFGPKGFESFSKVEVLIKKLGVGKNLPYVVGWVRKFDKVCFLGSTCYREDIGKSVNKVVHAVNTVANMGFTKASLMPLGVIKLHPEQGENEGKLIVLSYVTLTDVGEQWVQQNIPKILVSEGQIPAMVGEQ